MERVILITTRQIKEVLSTFNDDCIQSISSYNYNKVFFVADTSVSALNRFLTEKPRGFNISQFDNDVSEEERELSVVLKDRALAPNHDVKQMFDALLYEDNINFLRCNEYTNIDKVRDGILRISGTNIFICHEWFSKTVSLKDDSDNLVEKTRKAYFKAIIDDIKCEINGNYEWIILAHDGDFGDSGCHEITDKDVLKNLGLKENKAIIWIYRHSTDDAIYARFILNKNPNKFDILITSEDVSKTLKEIVSGYTDISQKDIDTCNETEIENNNKVLTQNGTVDFYRLIDCEVLFKSIRSKDKGITDEMAEQQIINTLIDTVANCQRTEELGIQSLKKEAAIGKISIPSNKITDKPIIVYWEGKPLSEINDKRRNYLDSSIWNRYADSKDDLEKINTELKKYIELYKTSNAIEVKEFKARMALNSFLVEVPNAKEHGYFVVPFVFHSETAMNYLVYNNKRDENNNEIEKSSLKAKLFAYSDKVKGEKLEWRFLIIDDNAYQKDGLDVDRKVDKCKVIARILDNDFYLKCESVGRECPKCSRCSQWINECNKNKVEADYSVINLECSTTLKDAHKKLKEKRYDIVLLDYLLRGDNDAREYGTTLLTDLKSQYDDKNPDNREEYIQTKGPFGKFWIFFISAFSNAIGEEMLSQGLHYNTDYWHIARGACPTTTPELFRYNLYSLLYQQIKDITNVSAVKTDNNFSKIDKRVVTLIDLLHYIFADQVSTRDLAMKNFNSLLHLRAHYDILKNDYYMGGKDKPGAEKNGSPLVQSLFPDLKYYNNAFWEHIQHLIYLIAFGNIRQWNEMWDEYIFIKDVLREAVGNPVDENNIVRKIEKYIIEIKNANYR